MLTRRISAGRVFHICGPATANDLSPRRVLVRGTANVNVSDDRIVGDLRRDELTIARQVPWYPAVQRLVHERGQLEVDAASHILIIRRKKKFLFPETRPTLAFTPRP